METKLNILFIEDVRSDAELIWREIERNRISFEKLLVDTRKGFLEGMSSFVPDVIISDYSLPQFDGMSALLLRNEHLPLVPFILVTGSINEEVAVDCMKAGADDYILKENLSRLGQALVNSINKAKLQKEKKIAEEELFESELRLQKAQAIAHVGNWEYNLSSRTIWFSDEALRIFGFNSVSHEIPLDFVQKRYLPEYKPALDDALNCLLKYNELYEVEYKIQRLNDGEIRSVYSKAELQTFRDSEQVKIVGVIQDITSRKRIEEELISAKERAEESDILKTAFLHNISHEIRTPMNAIVGFSILLGEPSTDEESRKSYIEIILHSCDHLLSIITDIVDISNIEANLVKINKSEVNIDSELKLLLDQFLPKAKERKLSLFFEPDRSHPVSTLFTDGTKLIQVVSNLVSNSLKFTDKGLIKFGYNLKNDHLEFFVTDTGVGIPAEHHKKIFERFYQIQDSVSGIFEGTGLGLSISKAYVGMLGGNIWLESEPGKGTTFYFTVPFEKSYLPVSESSDKEQKKDQLLKYKKTILIAEDTDSNFKLLTYILSGLNAEILRANNGKETVDICLSNPNIDLILLDIKMPVMDGYTAAKLIHAAIPAIPIIVQTAYSDDRDKAIESGCAGFISKPFDKIGLLKVISEFI
jgi:signal transduction histidine kinase/DNA-binding response OmpR family regulator